MGENMNLARHIAEHAALMIPANEGLTMLLSRTNLVGVAFVNMNNSDCTLTEGQAQCAIIVPLNVGDGTKILTNNSTNAPAQQIVFSVYCDNSFIYKSSAGYTSALTKGLLFNVVVSQIAGVLDISASAKSSNNGTVILPAGDTAPSSHFNFGKLYVASDANPQTITINGNLPIANLTFDFTCEGAGGLKIIPEMDGGTPVVNFIGQLNISGEAVFPNGSGGWIVREGVTENYRIFRNGI